LSETPEDPEELEETLPLEVKIIKEKEQPEPDVDYDNYLPSEKEIIETEQEIEKIALKKKVTT